MSQELMLPVPAETATEAVDTTAAEVPAAATALLDAPAVAVATESPIVTLPTLPCPESEYRTAARQALALPAAARRLKKHLEAILPLRNASRSGEKNAVIHYIKAALDGMGRPYQTDRAFNIYAPPLLLPEGWSLRGIVGHTDSVSQYGGEDIEPITYDGGVYRSLNGKRPIGGDDKVGVAIALTLIEFLPFLSGVFPADEEVGCVGAEQMELPKHYLMVECDRRGGEDIVTEIGCTQMLSDEAAKAALALLPHRKAANGLFTDVLSFRTRDLTDHATNLSCGYYQPHTNQEHIVFAQAFQTLIDALALLTELPDGCAAGKSGWRRSHGGGGGGGTYNGGHGGGHGGSRGYLDDVDEWDAWWNEGGGSGGSGNAAHLPFGPNGRRHGGGGGGGGIRHRHNAHTHHADVPPPGVVVPSGVTWANLSKRLRKKLIRDSRRNPRNLTQATAGIGTVSNRVRAMFGGGIPPRDRAPEIYKYTGKEMNLIGRGSLYKLNIDRIIQEGLYYEIDQWEHAEDAAGYWHLFNVESRWLYVYDSHNNRWCLRTDRRDSSGGTLAHADEAITNNAGI